ncbi:MAG: dioxygenase [Beijerinckiaceae bacterium]
MDDFIETGADRLTRDVVSRIAAAPDPRIRETLQALVRHLHAFVREVRPSEAEWTAAIGFLTRTGQICTDRRQEFILLSDTLGVSMLVDLLNHGRGGAGTETTVLGPFYVASPPEIAQGGDIAAGLPGEPVYIEGVVSSQDGAPLAGAIVDVWQSDDQGRYDLQFENPDTMFLRGRLVADAQGRFGFWSIMPKSYPIPTDGPVGALLATAGRHPYRPAHVHFRIAAPGCAELVTHIFVSGDEYLTSDVVFAVKQSLIADFETRTRTIPLAGPAIEKPHRYLRYDFVLQRAQEAAAAG